MGNIGDLEKEINEIRQELYNLTMYLKTESKGYHELLEVSNKLDKLIVELIRMKER